MRTGDGSVVFPSANWTLNDTRSEVTFGTFPTELTFHRAPMVVTALSRREAVLAKAKAAPSAVTGSTPLDTEQFNVTASVVTVCTSPSTAPEMSDSATDIAREMLFSASLAEGADPSGDDANIPESTLTIREASAGSRYFAVPSSPFNPLPTWSSMDDFAFVSLVGHDE